MAGVRVAGNRDTPEDVIGGLNQALKLKWPESSGSRILFHVGDAPPHGRVRYHNHWDDEYPTGHPNDRPLDELFNEMCSKEVTYYFGRINNDCDKMIDVFEQHYGGTIDVMDSSKVSSLATHVTFSVMKTVTSTCDSTMSTIKMEGSAHRNYVLDKKEPNWTRLPTLDATIKSYKLPDSISSIIDFSQLEDTVRKCTAQIAPNPFDEGSVRLAYYGNRINSKIWSNSHLKLLCTIGRIIYTLKDEKSTIDEVVFKEMIKLPQIPELDRHRYMADLEVQTVASKLAFEFNDRLGKTNKNPNLKLKFLMAKVIRFDNSDDEKPPRFMAYEKRFHGPTPKMVRYTNNLDFIRNPGADKAAQTRVELAIAFSHFSHSITDGYLLVCDLQGIVSTNETGRQTLLLTDPAIHCPKHVLRFGKTNLRDLGIEKFFARHVCNEFCRALGLKIPSLTF